MKVKVIQPYFDGELHKIGDIVESKWFDEHLMVKIKEEKKDAAGKGKTRTANKH